MFGKIALAATVAGASAHLCTFQPIQRGGVEGAEYAGNNTCLHVTGPCDASVPSGNPVSAYLPGERVYAHVQKNLDHFYAASPGNFSAFLWDAEGHSTLLASTPDSAAPSLSMYDIIGQIPKTAAAGQYVLQTVYWPNNPSAPGAFYQCSDIAILNPGPVSAEAESRAREHCKKHM